MIFKLIFYYILFSIRHGVLPWRFFQLNAEYFNAEKGVYSKIDIDQYIPNQWRLPQFYLHQNNLPKKYPVVIKPEWGQNGYGVRIIYTKDELKHFINHSKNKIPYIVQTLAEAQKEYEIFYIQDPNNEKKCISLTITEAVNYKEKYPLNSIHNKHTYYYDKTASFNIKEQETIKRHLGQLPCFRIARVGIRSDSKVALLNGHFKIIEINLFTPFPLNLLDKTNHKKHHQFIRDNMRYLAILSSKIPKENFKPFLFWKKLKRHYQIQSQLF